MNPRFKLNGKMIFVDPCITV